VQTRSVGASGLGVGRLGLGTATWGAETDADEAARCLGAFADAGGTLVVVSDAHHDRGLVGGLLSPARSGLVIAGQTGGTWPPAAAVPAADPAAGPAGHPPAGRRGLLTALDRLLAELGTDALDLWLLSGWAEGVPLQETLSAVDIAVSSGRVRYAGLASVAGWQLAAAAVWQQALRDRVPLVAVGAELSLLDRRAEAELLPAARACGVGLLAWSPLGRGVLTGKYRTGIPADSRAATEQWQEELAPLVGERGTHVVDALLTAADGLGVEPTAVALGWVLQHDGVAAAVTGPRTAAQLLAALDAERLTLPAEIAAALDDVSRPA